MLLIDFAGGRRSEIFCLDVAGREHTRPREDLGPGQRKVPRLAARQPSAGRHRTQIIGYLLLRCRGLILVQAGANGAGGLEGIRYVTLTVFHQTTIGVWRGALWNAQLSKS